MIECRYDVFLSFTGADRAAGRALAHELRKLGMRVFSDESIGHFEGISESIQHALSGSTVLVAYYSTEFACRPACQLELTAALLAGQREGDPCRRILVVNPEPGSEHVLPGELADARYAAVTAWAGSDEFVQVAQAIRTRVLATPGVIGQVSFKDYPPWLNRHAGSYGFQGRYRETWAMHTALHATDFPLTQEPSAAAVLTLWGERGSGRTALTAGYAWRFGSGFRGGVYWLSAAGARTGLENYLLSVRGLGQRLGLGIENVCDRRLIGVIGDYLATRPGRCLWVVDDLPQSVSPDALAYLVPSGGGDVRTVLIGENHLFPGLGPTLEIRKALPLRAAAQLAEAEAQAILAIAAAETDPEQIHYLRRRANSALDAELIGDATKRALLTFLNSDFASVKSTAGPSTSVWNSECKAPVPTALSMP